MRYKKILTRLTIVFVGIILFLTFFSRTLVDMHVPRVSVAFVQSGVIAPEARSSGIVRPADSERIFSPASGRITQIVEAGDNINANTVLFTITSDMQHLMDMLTQAEHERSINALNIDRVRSEQTAEQQRLNQMIAEPVSTLTRPTLNLWEYDMQLESNDNDVARIHEDLESLAILYEEGIIPRQNIIDRESDLVRLAQAREQIYQRRNRTIQNHEAALEAYEESAANMARNRETQIQNQRDRITQIGFTLDMHQLDTERINSRINNLLEQVEADGVVEVQLDGGGFTNRTVYELMPGITVGSIIHEGAPVMITTLRNNRFIIEASFPQADGFIRTGQGVSIVIGENDLDGTTSRITPDGARNIVTIDVESSRLIGGELAFVTVSGTRSNQPSIIPLSALREDSNGYYIFFIERVERIFGSHYYVRTQRVNVRGHDHNNAAVTSSFGMDEVTTEPIIINSDMPVRVGERVRLVASYDFEPSR